MDSAEITIPLTQAHTNGANSHNAPVVPPVAVRRRLPDERRSLTHRFSIGGHKGYLTVGLYPTGEPGELFVVMAKEGSTVSGLVSSFAQVVSIALQYGVPLAVLCDKFVRTRFEPSGFTGNPAVPMATSVMDYIFQWLKLRFIGNSARPPSAHEETTSSDSPSCHLCGTLMRRNGSCHACPSCGWTNGCG